MDSNPNDLLRDVQEMLKTLETPGFAPNAIYDKDGWHFAAKSDEAMLRQIIGAVTGDMPCPKFDPTVSSKGEYCQCGWVEHSHEERDWIVALLNRVAALEELLNRLHGWDVMDLPDGDGRFWRAEIRKVVAAPEPE